MASLPTNFSFSLCCKWFSFSLWLLSVADRLLQSGQARARRRRTLSIRWCIESDCYYSHSSCFHSSSSTSLFHHQAGTGQQGVVLCLEWRRPPQHDHHQQMPYRQPAAVVLLEVLPFLRLVVSPADEWERWSRSCRGCRWEKLSQMMSDVAAATLGLAVSLARDWNGEGSARIGPPIKFPLPAVSIFTLVQVKEVVFAQNHHWHDGYSTSSPAVITAAAHSSTEHASPSAETARSAPRPCKRARSAAEKTPSPRLCLKQARALVVPDLALTLACPPSCVV